MIEALLFLLLPSILIPGGIWVLLTKNKNRVEWFTCVLIILGGIITSVFTYLIWIKQY